MGSNTVGFNWWMFVSLSCLVIIGVIFVYVFLFRRAMRSSTASSEEGVLMETESKIFRPLLGILAVGVSLLCCILANSSKTAGQMRSDLASTEGVDGLGLFVGNIIYAIGWGGISLLVFGVVLLIFGGAVLFWGVPEEEG